VSRGAKEAVRRPELQEGEGVYAAVMTRAHCFAATAEAIM
jgi:hypothetical protein